MKLDSEERIFTLGDVRRLIGSHRGLLTCLSFFGACLSLLFAVIRPAVYEIEATFKEGADQSGVQASIRDLFLSGFKESSNPQAAVFMQAHHVMRPVIERRGLQAKVLRRSALRQVQRHLRAQFKLPLAETDWFEFENLNYEGEETLLFSLRFCNRNQFEVFDEKGFKLGDGWVGKPVVVNGTTFTCSKIPSELFLNNRYSLEISSWIEVEKKLKKNLTIVRQRDCQSIYELTLLFPDRWQGAQILNDLMGQYRAYLKSDRDEVARDQIVYLEQKQADICKQFEALFDEHAAYLTAAMKEKGLIGLAQEMQSYVNSYEEMRGKILAIDMELERIDSQHGLSSELSGVFQQLRSLEHERGVLLKSLPESDLLVEASDTVPTPWAREGEWIDLDSAKALYAEYAAKLDAAEGLRSSLVQFKDKIQEDEFDISSLSSVLNDPLSQSLIASASALSSLFKETKYCSDKERQRWKEDIELQKTNLREHLEQMSEVEAINANMAREKIVSLQRIVLSGIERQMVVLEEQIQEEVSRRTIHLQDEKQILQKKMEQLRAYAADLPQRWKLETWLQMKTDMGKKIMTSMVELVESKTIGRHLHTIESKPIDLALAPLTPRRSPLLLFLLLGAVGCPFAGFWPLFLNALLKGFPLTGSKLKALGYPFAGEIGAGLETLRQIGLFLKESHTGQIIALLGDKGPNYSYDLAKNLKRSGKKVCIVDCGFTESEGPGLLQWLQGELDEIPITQGEVDRVVSGGFSPFGCEFMQTQKLQKGLEQLKNIYDYIFLWHCPIVDGAEAKILLNLSHKAVVSVAAIQTEQLTPLLDWAYHEGNSRITFISFPG